MSDEIEEVVEEEIEEVNGIRASLDDVIGETKASDLDDFDPPLYDAPKEDVEVAAKETEVETEVVNKTPTEDAEPTTAVSTEKPPLDWGVEVREEWKNLPANVKAHLHARDQHVNTMLQDGANNRKLGEGLLQIATPYKAIMDAEGVGNPLDAVNGLFKSVATLRMGTMQEKAAKIAQFVEVYGVDVNALDNALVGNSAENAPENDPVASMIDQRMAPVNQLLEQLNQNKQYQEQHAKEKTDQDINAFSKDAEFFEDVRDDMADFLEAAARRNQSMTLQQAYDKSCALNPQISNVMGQRAANNNLVGNRNNIAAKRNAASSIKSNTSRQPTTTRNNLRGALMDAFNDHA